MRLSGIVAACLLLSLTSFAWPQPTRDSSRPVQRPQPQRRVSAQAAPLPRTALEAAWQAAVAGSPVTRSAHISAYAYDLSTHQVLAAIDPTSRQIPASIMKMFTTAAALQDLGPNFTYETRVEASPAVGAGQAGPIYLVGGGNAWLEAQGNQGLEQLAAQVAKKVSSASRVVGVGTLFSGPRAGAGWSAGELAADYGAGPNALEAELSSVEVYVQAGRQAGQPVTASLHFRGRIAVPGYFKLHVTARTVQGSSPPPNVTRLMGSETIVVSGAMQAGTSLAVNISPADPAHFAAALFQAALQQQGVRFTAPAVSGSLPGGQDVIASLASPPLRLLLPLQNRYSINQMADNLLRAVGLKVEGSGSASSAQAAMNAFLTQAGLPGMPPQYDGSGLSPLDLESAQGVVSLLTYAASRPWFPSFRSSMMEAGNPNPQVCGILCGHFVGTPAEDKVWLKTGNLANQWNYAGYATAANGDQIAFAVLEEGPGASALASSYGRPSPIDQMVIDLATWPSEPSGSVAAPATPAPLPAFLQAVLHDLPAEAGAVQGVAVLDLKTGHMVYTSGAQQLVRTNWLPRVGLLAATLQDGPRTFGSPVVAARGPVQGGVLQGALVLDGAMDPILSRQDLSTLAAEVRQKGIRAITGPLLYLEVGPSSADASRWPDGATWEELGQSYLPPVGRLLYQGDLVRIDAQSVGGTIKVSLDPQDAPIKVITQGVSSGSQSGGHLSAAWSPSRNAFVLSGSLAPGATQSLEVSAPDAGLLAATEFRDALTQAGVSVQGGIGSTDAIGTARQIASLAGPSVASLARPLLASPSTLDAAQLAQLLGSSSAAALRQVLGAPDMLPDPTGSSFDDYVTPASAVGLLSQIWRSPRDLPLREALGANGPWQVSAPGTALVAGYFKGPDGTPYAVAALESGLGWQGDFGATIVPPAP